MTSDAVPERAGRARTGKPTGPPSFDFESGEGRHRVWGTAFLTHGGLTVNLVGGEVPHIGAIAVSVPRPSLADPRRRSATTSVFTVVGHKEDEIARPIAAKLARALGRITVVVAGMHLRRATAADIAALVRNAGRATRLIIAAVNAAARRSGRDVHARRAAGPTARIPAGRGRRRW